MIAELDRVVLTESVPEHKLEPGDIGTVVMVHRDGEGYSVEFVTLGGETVALVTREARFFRPVDTAEIAHVRRVA